MNSLAETRSSAKFLLRRKLEFLIGGKDIGTFFLFLKVCSWLDRIWEKESLDVECVVMGRKSTEGDALTAILVVWIRFIGSRSLALLGEDVSAFILESE